MTLISTNWPGGTLDASREGWTRSVPRLVVPATVAGWPQTKTSPGAARPGQGHRGRQVIERLGPVVAPHLEVDIDHVVGGLGKTEEPVGQVEGSLLAKCGVVPHDPDPATEVDEAERRWRRVATEVGAAARGRRGPPPH